MSYKPLPDEVTIKKSSIDGLGLFARKNIKANVLLGITHIHNEHYPNRYIRTPLGGFINHSETPNVQLIRCAESRDIECGTLILQTIRDIKKGEEMCLKYKMYNV